jgi:hypothetical protein
MYPSLVNCTTIDLFADWPQDALLEVGERYLSQIELAGDDKVSCVSTRPVHFISSYHINVDRSITLQFPTVRLPCHYHIVVYHYTVSHCHVIVSRCLFLFHTFAISTHPPYLHSDSNTMSLTYRTAIVSYLIDQCPFCS